MCPGESRKLPRNALNPEAIAAIGRDGDLKEPILFGAARIRKPHQGFNFETGHGQQLGELRRRRAAVDQLFEPIEC